jgi:CCR4-NOT complex subunit CAF16
MLQADIGVSEMMSDSQRTHKERRDMLVSLLGIDLDWRMHQLSDGQRRRVQIMLQLLRPSKLLLLDEITTDLDLITRQDFLAYMRKISEEDNVTVIYATHIFDGLDDWGTHLAYVADGGLKRFGKVEEFEDLEGIRAAGSVAPLFQCVAHWLRSDRDAKRAAGKSVVEDIPPSVDELRGAAGNGYLPGRFSQGFN